MRPYPVIPAAPHYTEIAPGFEPFLPFAAPLRDISRKAGVFLPFLHLDPVV